MQTFILMALLRVDMNRPDGMGADRHRERQNMKEARQDVPAPSHDIVAIDSDGNEAHVAESAWTEDAAEEELEACQSLLENDPERFPNISHFTIRERDN